MRPLNVRHANHTMTVSPRGKITSCSRRGAHLLYSVSHGPVFIRKTTTRPKEKVRALRSMRLGLSMITNYHGCTIAMVCLEDVSPTRCSSWYNSDYHEDYSAQALRH